MFSASVIRSARGTHTLHQYRSHYCSPSPPLLPTCTAVSGGQGPGTAVSGGQGPGTAWRPHTRTHRPCIHRTNRVCIRRYSCDRRTAPPFRGGRLCADIAAISGAYINRADIAAISGAYINRVHIAAIGAPPCPARGRPPRSPPLPPTSAPGRSGSAGRRRRRRAS